MAQKSSARPLAFSEAVNLLAKSGIPFSPTAFLGNANEAACLSAAEKLGFPAFLKVVSSPTKDVAIHKAKQGLVARVENAQSFPAAYKRLAAAHSKLASKKLVERKLVLAIQKEASGLECIIGAKLDLSFGPVIVFGSGGILAEELGDVAVRLCPVTAEEASAMIKGTRLYSRLQNLKGNSIAQIGLRPIAHSAVCGIALQNLAAAIVKVSNLIMNHPEIRELDINPVFVSEDSGDVAAVDVRAVIKESAAKAAKKKRTAAAKITKPAGVGWKPAAVTRFFSPASVAVIGASRHAESVGQSIMRNLTLGCVHRCEYCRPFLGKLFPVNPFATEILGFRSYPTVLSTPEDVDMAIIAVPHDIVMKAVDDCIKKKVKSVIIISAGFGEFNEEGRRLQLKIVEKLEKARIPMLGPNCLGIIRPVHNLNASFGPSMPPKGQVAFVSQSGALADSIIDWSIQARYGFSAIISYGNKAMLDCYDFFDFLANDDETRAVAVYLEGINNGRDFFEKLRQLATKKPVVILKGGRTSSGVTAAATHTASLAGDAKIFEAAARQTSAVIADTVEELFDLAKVLAEQPVCSGNGIGIITNGGGCGVICSDYCDELGVNLPQLSKDLLKAFDKSGLMHPAYSRRNPLDIVGDAMADRYELAINALLKEPYIHGLIIIQTLQAMTNPVLDAKAVVEAHKLFPGKPIISCFMGGRFSKKGMHYLDNMHIPDFNDIRKAVVAMKALIDRGEFLAGLDSGTSAATAAKVVKTAGKRK